MPDYDIYSNKAPWYSDRDKIKIVVIEDGVTSIGNNAFLRCRNIISIKIPNSVTSIGERAFESCETLRGVEIPNSVTSIGNRAFSYCDALPEVTIPNSVKSIGDRAFEFNKRLVYITFMGSTPPELGKDVFYEVNELVSVKVPANSVEAYKDALGDLSSNITALNLIALADNAPYTMDSQSDGINVSYTRNFTNVKWQALYLPFSLKYEDWKDDFEMAYINGIIQRDNDDDGEIDETEVEIIKMKSGSTQPNAPYLIRAKTTGEKTLSVKNTTVYAAPEEEKFVDCSTTTATFFFVGTYNTIPYETLAEYGYYAMGGGELVMSNGSDLKPFRWFMVVETRSYRPSSHDRAKVITLKVLDEEETTGVANIQHQSANTQLYDLNGRKVSENNLKPGVYVKNGKKFVVK